MSILKSCFVIPVAVIATVAMSSVAMAQCQSCGTAGGSAGFGYPTSCADGNCGIGGGALGTGYFKQSIDQYKADHALARARNDAWPKPFNCWDREVYNSIFAQQYNTGLQVAHMLTSEHFDPETNKLNDFGQGRVAWIMQRSASADKQIFVYQDETAPTMERRVASVRTTVDRWYGHLGGASVATSTVRPTPIPASYQAVIGELYGGAQPDPIIPVDAGSTINSSVGN